MADEVERIAYTHIGGQAVLEGVMMRGKRSWAIAVRTPSGEIHVEDHDLEPPSDRRPWLAKPVVRGVVALVDTLVLAMKAFSISAQYSGETEDEQLTGKEVAWSMVIGVALAIGLFIVAPALLTNWVVGPATERPFMWNLLDGLLRVVAFFAYIWAVSRIKEIQRVFAYHGAEHKTIHAYEHGLALEPALIQRYSTAHVRCGTSFLLMVMIVALIVFSLLPVRLIAAGFGIEARWGITLIAITLRLILMPVIAGLAYEVIKWAGNHQEAPLVKVLLWPGLQLQRMTTREPDDDMIEVAVAAVLPVIRREGLIDGSSLPEAHDVEEQAVEPELGGSAAGDEAAAFT